MKGKLNYPGGAEFAFTILDDTDDTTMENGRPVYDLLKQAGLRTTKTVWAFDTAAENQGPYFAGQTLASPDYLEWVKELSLEGFEIAFHNATMGSSTRQDTIRALDYIEREIGQPIRLHCNHGQNRENLYWGPDRYSTYILKKILQITSRREATLKFDGHDPQSPYYWADVAAARLSYMRAFAFRHLNGRQIVPGGPFKDRLKKETPMLFNTADAPDVHAFNKLVNTKSLEKLRKQRGWAIVSTHLGKGFYWDKQLNPDFQRTIQYLKEQPGWYVPASQLLDRISSEQSVNELGVSGRFMMEMSHVMDRVISRFL